MAHVKTIIFIVLSIYLFGFCKSAERNSGFEKNILSSFRQQLLNAKVNLTKSLIQMAKTKRETSPLNIKWNHQWSEAIENSNTAFMQYVNNKIFILSKDTAYNLNGGIPKFKLTPIISLQDISGQISFIESIEWENILFSLLGLNNGQCRLMTATNKLDFSIRQTISNLDNPVDAEFFILNNNLYVVIVFNQMDDTKVATRIYRWRNTHLDEEPANHIKTEGAISVTTFTYKESVMIIVGQESKDKQQISSQVLKMKSNGLIEKVQFLPTKRLVSIKHFTMANEEFIFVLEKEQPSTIYWWEGKEFVQWLALPEIFGDFKLSVFYVGGNTLILLYKQQTVTVYTMTWQKLHKVMMMGYSGEVVNAVLYEGEKIYLVVVVKTDIVTIQMVELIIDSKFTNTEIQPPVHKTDPVIQCVKELEDSVNLVEDKVRFLRQTLPKVLYNNEPARIRGIIKVLGPSSAVNIETGQIQEVMLQNSNITAKSRVINEEILDIINRTSVLSTKIQQEKSSGESKTLILENDLTIKEGRINSVKTNIVNKVLFNPEKFISLSDDQRLVANIVSKDLKVDWLVADLIENKITKNLVPKDNTIGSKQSLSSLYCDNIDLLPLINGINITNILTRKTNVTLKGETLVEELVVRDLKAQSMNEEKSLKNLFDLTRSKKTENLRLLDNTYIQSLNVQEINGINIDNLMNNLVLRGENNTIIGDLYFRYGLQVDELVTQKFKAGLKSTNMNYQNNELYRGRETLREKRESNPSNSTNSMRRLIIYTGKVKIEGDLHVNKLLLSSHATLHLKNYSTPIMMTNINKMFWTKHSNQIIGVPVTFGNGSTVQGDLDVESINGYDLNAFDTTATFSDLKFHNVSVNKFVMSENVRDNKILDFKRLNTSIVRKEGVHFINGEKSFHNNLSVNHLQTELINEIKPNQAFITEDSTVWNNIVVSNLLVAGDLNTQILNKINLSEEFQNIVLTHKNYNLKSVKFTNLTGNIVELLSLNNIGLKELMQNLAGDKNKVYYKGNLKVPAILSTETINGKFLKDFLLLTECNDLLKEAYSIHLHNSKQCGYKLSSQYFVPTILVVNGSNPSIIRGEKTFRSQVIVEDDISMTTLNAEILQKVFDNRLSRTKQQDITGFYTLRGSKMGFLSAAIINGVNFDNFVFINDPIITIKSNLLIQELTLSSNSTAVNLMGGCVLPKVGDSITFPHDINWSSLHVDNDVRWKSNSSKGIQKLLDSAVLKEGDQVISGNVVFNSLLKADRFEAGLINDFNISFMLDDAVVKNVSNQVVFGHKEFTRNIWCSHCKFLKDARISTINKVNITELSNKIIMYNTDNVISGHKTFKNGFKAFKFESEDINGIKAEDIVTENTKSRQPHAVFRSLEIIEDLTVGKINNLNLTDFIGNLVTLRSEHPQTLRGQVVFKRSVQLAGESTIKSINSIDIEKTLFSYNFDTKPQHIIGCTKMTEIAVINGHLDVDKINGKFLSEKYKSSILNNGNYTIHGNLVFDNKQYVQTVHGKQYFSKDLQLSHFNQSFENKHISPRT